VKLYRRIAVLIPAGPRDDILDTLASVIHYSEHSRVIVVVDDSQVLVHKIDLIHELSQDIVVIPAPADAPGVYGGLWVKLAAGYRWILENYETSFILRMDADALLIGRGLEEYVDRAFFKNPNVGLLGAYKISPDGGARDSSWAARQLRSEVGIRGLHKTRSWFTLRNWLRLARRNDYIDGDSVLGGAYIHRYEAADRIYKFGWFDQPWMASSKLGEDHIMSLLTMACGYKIEDFSGPMDPMALKWKGLPAHPHQLLASGKLITHSVRSWADLDEDRVREIFANARRVIDYHPGRDSDDIS
jgi:hypothetical protein